MKLVYVETQQPVNVGDIVTLDRGPRVKVEFFREPYTAASSGKVSVSDVDAVSEGQREFYVGVIGAEWIEREDRL